MVHVVVVHEHNLLKASLAALLRSDESLEVSEASWEEVERDAAVRGAVDVWITDAASLRPGVSLRGGGALLVLVAPDQAGALRRAYEAGAAGYVDKDGPRGRLIDAVHRVARGGEFIDGSLALSLLQAAEMPLTQRERGVLVLAAEGASTADIAATLHLSLGTVRNYIASATRKAGARNRLDAVRIGRQAGWI
ncbi:response regulator transcription factor [Streptomyces sp. JJ38]|uniref:response regulator transcription factor n=1 Tax=Streptomyces sp. JJ38 TaxID=2738128 RepID=UPI001C57DD27|nr:response regulator transcription factor [Streptomyces sp. JJ38]MBW1599196.1 response regulator transcription factor [Streptomyces sp. JJ38]